ncbi:hypothetical protein ACIGW8_09695 [Streptomyces sioyaensis]|uniref:hypothetical protein n=1 Tax=Streptomyces sioyaensis TaxID=67364 RepID=UPI0037D09ED8
MRVRRQVKMVRTKLCFALLKGHKIRDVPLPSSVAKSRRQHMEHFAPVPVTMPWDAPSPPQTPVEAKHRRLRTYDLLVTGRERKAINRNHFNSYVWKSALAEAGVIAAMEKSASDGSRVWEPSREHGYRALRHFYASEQLEAGESVVSLARWLGSTAAAVRYERLTGREVGGKSHSQKAENSITFLKNWIQKNPGADQADRNIAERLIRDMQDALDGK